MSTSSPEPSVLTGSTLPASSRLYTTPSTSATPSAGFSFPPHTSFPPFYTLQPNLTTRARQLSLWSGLVTSYCQYHRIFRVGLSSLPQDLFSNTSIKRCLASNDVRMVIDWMSKAENGSRIEWVPSTGKGEQSSSCWVYWKTPSEWADAIYGWVEETGQKGAVLTVYEIREGDAVRSKEWRDMDEALLRKALNVLVKRGKAQVFGEEENAGVKFF